MGYRSRIESCIYGDKDVMAQLILKERGHEQSVFDQFKGRIEIVDVGDWKRIQLSLDDYKWYESYDGVQAWIRLLNTIDTMANAQPDINLCFEFIRVGEDVDDIENRSGGNQDHIEWYLGTHTEITRDY